MFTPHELDVPADGPGTLRLGAMVAGKYRIKRLVGKGGMGAVYKAENTAIGRTVAIKVLHSHLADDGVTLKRFQREARAAAGIKHSRVVEVLDMGVEASGEPYIVMEYVRGRSLSQLVRPDHPISVRRAADIAGQILDALGTVHEAGIVHRDLKPANVLLTVQHGRPDFVKVFDFGIATFVESAWDATSTGDLTPSGRTMGTPYYSPPEQIRGASVRDPRVDIYAVGVILYELVTGYRPFRGDHLVHLCRSIMNDPPPPLRVFRQDVPEAFEAIIQKALAKDPADRYQTARAMISALVPFGADPPVEEDVEPTDTLTTDLRTLRERERQVRSERGSVPPGPTQLDDLSGAVVVELREYLTHRIGQAGIAEVLAASAPEVHARWVANISDQGWYPATLLNIIEVADRRFGKGDRKFVVDAGAHLADAARRAGRMDHMKSPELCFMQVAPLLGSLFCHGQPRATKHGSGYGELEVTGHPRPTLTLAVLMVGFLQRALMLAGAREVDVRLAKVAALGDPADVFEATSS